ncbi:MAG: hypothetical protein IJZ87_04255 [Bacteroidales bacterium]|nr:hypothetical protein [Bacteroidales bacterium]
MKRLAFVTLFMALVVAAFSQETKNDTVVVNGDNVEVLINNNKIKISDSSNGLKINVFTITEDGEVEKNPYYESRYENNVSSKTEKKNVTINFPIKPTFIKDDKYVSSDKDVKLKFSYFDPIYPNIYYAYSAMVGFPFSDYSLRFNLQRANSFEWGSYLFQHDICHNKRKTIGLTTALGISNTYFYTSYILGTTTTDNSNNYTYFYRPIDSNEEGNPVPDGLSGTNTPEDFRDGYYRYWSLRLPVSVQFQWRVGSNRMAFSFGPEFEWRFAMKSFTYFQNDKLTVSNNLAYNPFGVNALAVLNFKSFVIFGRAGLTQLFNQDNSSIRVTPVNLGIGFSF